MPLYHFSNELILSILVAMRFCSWSGGIGIIRFNTSSLLMPGITPCICSRKVNRLYCRNIRMYSTYIPCGQILMICRAMWASFWFIITIFPTPAPLHTINNWPFIEMHRGVGVHRLIINSSLTILLAPVIYGTPIPWSLYDEGSKSCPEINCITALKRQNIHLSGISNGISSSIHRSESPNFS